jgi:hypothetical protein
MIELSTWCAKALKGTSSVFLLRLTLCTTLLYSGCAGLSTSVTPVPPTISIISPASGAKVSGIITVSANATDPAGVASVQFHVDANNVGSTIASLPYNFSLNTTTLSNGNHTLNATAIDIKNLSSTSAAVTFTVNNASAPPTVSITAPASGANVSGTITVSATVTDSATVTGVQFKVDGSNTGSPDTAAPYSLSLNTTTLSNGSHTLTAVATDSSNNTAGSAGVTINVNNASNASPTVSITSPAPGAPVSGTITLQASASSSAGIGSVQFLVDSVDLGAPVMANPYSTSWNTTTVIDGSHTLTAIATDNSGKTATSAPVALTVDNAASGNADADYQARCGAAGVVLCVGFDSATDIAGTYGSPSGVLPSSSGSGIVPTLDTTVKASGNSSLMFTVPAKAGADTSGTYWTNFSRDFSKQFGQNSDFFVQWRQRFSPEFLSTNPQGAEGWKQVIEGTGDVVGCTPSTSASGACVGSCTNLEVVTLDGSQRGFAQMYDSCSGSASHGPYDPLVQPYGSYDFKLQNAMPSPYCLYLQGQTSPPSYFPPTGNCFGYFPNEWMTFQVEIKTGPWVNGEFQNSHVNLWIAREGQPAVQVFDWGPYNLSADPKSATAQMYGKIWLLPYNTGRDPSVAYPVSYTWYDELIISTQRIADPTH